MIRELRDGDLGEVAALLRRLCRDNLHSERGVRHDIETEPARAEPARWVVEDGGVVGFGFVIRRWWREANHAQTWVGVAPEARGRGLGRALWELADERIASFGADAVFADVVDDPAGEAFVRARGFVPERIDRVSVLDPRTADLSGLEALELRAAADGYTVVGLDAVRDREALYRLDLEIADDMPGIGSSHSLSFAEWEASLLGYPDLHHEASAVVVHDGRPVALAFLGVDEESRRARNEETGTARAHRSRGLATLAKLATIRWAREHGIEAILTDNAEENAAMLAINERLGYRPLLVRRRWVRRRA